MHLPQVLSQVILPLEPLLASAMAIATWTVVPFVPYVVLVLNVTTKVELAFADVATAGVDAVPIMFVAVRVGSARV